MRQEGLFVALEGGDGAGKSTQARLLAEHLRAAGREVVLTFEPGDCSIGPAVRSIVLGTDTRGLSPGAEALLYAADRAQHVAEVVRPALERGAVVVTDRYVDSSIAYQGAGRRLGVSEVEALQELATDGLLPDLTVLLDLDPVQGLARLQSGEADRIEAEPRPFHDRVRKAFLELVGHAMAPYLVLDAALAPTELAAEIAEAVDAQLAARA